MNNVVYPSGIKEGFTYRTINGSFLRDNAHGGKQTKNRARKPFPKDLGVMSSVHSTPGNKKRKRTNKFFLMLIILLSLLLAGEVCFHLFIAPNLLIQKIQIVTDDAIGLSNSDILKLAGVGKKEYYFSLEPEIIQKRLQEYPMVKEAEVAKVFPDKLIITITGRESLGVILVNVENVVVPAAFDDEGVVFQIGTSVTEAALPVISGVKTPSIQLGMKLPGELKAVLKDLKTLKSSYPELFSLISEIKFVKKKDSRYEVLIYLQQYPTRVRIGERLDAELLKYIVMVLDVFQHEELGVADELDFRTGEVVFKTYEAGYNVDG